MSAQSPGNPYQPPSPENIPHQRDLQGNARTVAASQGVQWVSSSWSIFKRAPWAIIGCWILWALISMGLSGVLPILSTLFTPVLLAGFAYSIDRLEQNGALDVADLFEGFKTRFSALLLLGGLMLLAMAGIVLIIAMMFAVLMSAMNSGHMTLIMALALICLLIGLGLLLFILFAMYWAPCLVFFQQQPPTVAIRNSIQGMTKNIPACIIYSLVLFLLNLVVLLTIGLAIFVVAPVIMISALTSYKDVFATYES